MHQYEMQCALECGQMIGRKGSRGLCAACMQKATRTAFALSPWRFCAVDGCPRASKSQGDKHCEMHCSRIRRDGVPGPAAPYYIKGAGGITKSGYHVRQVDGRRIPEHRRIVEESLGRTLWDFENVHHKNGVRADNRIGNLEIWVVPQPKGQRPADLAAWCAEHWDAIQEAIAWNAA